ADTIASTRRYYAVQREKPAVVDGRLRPPAPAHGSAISFEGVSFSYPDARRQNDNSQPAAALLGSGCRADSDRRGQSARFRARPSARTDLARLAGHLS